MNSDTMATVSLLKNTEGNYLLWAPGRSQNAPTAMLLGRPVVEAVNMPAIAAGTFPIVLGNFAAGYRLYDRQAVAVLRDPFTLARKNQTRFIGRRRVAGNVQRAAAFRKLKTEPYARWWGRSGAARPPPPRIWRIS